MNGSPRRTRSSFEFWFAIGLASFSLNRPSTRSPVMPANPSPCRSLLPGRLGAGRPAGPAPAAGPGPLGGLRQPVPRPHRCAARPAPMGDLIGPALPVPPPVLVAAFGIGLPAAGSGSSHDSLLCASAVSRHYAVSWRARLASLSTWQRKSTGCGRRAPSRSSSSTPAWCCSRVVAGDHRAGRRVVVVRRGLGRAAADRDGARRRSRGPARSATRGRGLFELFRRAVKAVPSALVTV